MELRVFHTLPCRFLFFFLLFEILKSQSPSPFVHTAPVEASSLVKVLLPRPTMSPSDPVFNPPYITVHPSPARSPDDTVINNTITVHSSPAMSPSETVINNTITVHSSPAMSPSDTVINNTITVHSSPTMSPSVTVINNPCAENITCFRFPFPAISPSPPMTGNCTNTTCNSTSHDKSNSNTNTTDHIIFIHTESNSKFQSSIVLSAATVGSVLLIVAVLIVIDYRKRVYFFKQRHGNEDKNSKVEQFLQDYVHEMPKRYTYYQIKKISNNFSDKLGEGGFGVVYKGKLRKGDIVAVKMLDQSRQSETQFMNEVATIGRIHHFHLVRLLGHCFEGRSKRALIYEYMVNGSLEKFIFKGDQENAKILSWEQLNSIALGTARGIAYLHEECSRRIIHFDIKPHNILLDGDFTPKVSDFGLAKLCGKGDDHISMTRAIGTGGYIAPELIYRDLGPVTDKSDIYSFGMMLLEMVGGRKNLDTRVSRPSQLYFPDWAFKLLQIGELETRLRRGSGQIEMGLEEKEAATKLTKVGMWCIQYNSTDRPSIGRVVQMLEGNADDVVDPPLPRNDSHSPPQLPSHAEESTSS